MSVQASWFDKKWVIDPKKILGLDGLSLKLELDAEQQEAKDGKNPINTKGFKPQTFSTRHKVNIFAGGDPLGEIEAWKKRLGERSPFYLEGRKLGPAVMVLDNVDYNATAFSTSGVILETEITLTFSEDTNVKAAPTAAVELYVGDTTKEKPGYNPTGATNAKSACDIRPSSSPIGVEHLIS